MKVDWHQLKSLQLIILSSPDLVPTKLTPRVLDHRRPKLFGGPTLSNVQHEPSSCWGTPMTPQMDHPHLRKEPWHFVQPQSRRRRHVWRPKKNGGRLKTGVPQTIPNSNDDSMFDVFEQFQIYADWIFPLKWFEAAFSGAPSRISGQSQPTEMTSHFLSFSQNLALCSSTVSFIVILLYACQVPSWSLVCFLCQYTFCSILFHWASILHSTCRNMRQTFAPQGGRHNWHNSSKCQQSITIRPCGTWLGGGFTSPTLAQHQQSIATAAGVAVHPAFGDWCCRLSLKNLSSWRIPPKCLTILPAISPQLILKNGWDRF